MLFSRTRKAAEKRTLTKKKRVSEAWVAQFHLSRHFPSRSPAHVSGFSSTLSFSRELFAVGRTWIAHGYWICFSPHASPSPPGQRTKLLSQKIAPSNGIASRTQTNFWLLTSTYQALLIFTTRLQMHCAKLRSISSCAWLVARGRVVINALSNDLFLLIASVIGAEQLGSSKVARLSVGRDTVASGA